MDGSVCPLSLFGARRFGRDNVYMRASAWVIPYTKSLVVVVPFWIFDRDGIVSFLILRVLFASMFCLAKLVHLFQISLDGIGICASVWVLYFALFWVERHT